MKTEKIEMTVVTFVDGSRAFFESAEMAAAVTGWYEKAQKLNAVLKVMGGGVAGEPTPAPAAKAGGKTFKPKPCPACGGTFVPHSAAQRVCDACKAAGRKAPKTTTTWKGQKPGGTPPPPEKPAKPKEPDLNCIEAGCFFCDGGSCSKLGRTANCEVQLVKNCRHFRSVPKKGQKASAMDEVRQLAAAANLGPYNPERSDDAS